MIMGLFNNKPKKIKNNKNSFTIKNNCVGEAIHNVEDDVKHA